MSNVITTSNTHGITPTVLSGAKGDGIFAQYTSKRLTDTDGIKENTLYLHNINIIPQLEEIDIILKDENSNVQKNVKVIYTKNPAQNRANTFVTAYVSERINGKNSEWEKLEKEELVELLNLKGISKENYRIGDIYSLLISMVSTILDKEEENNALIKYFSEIYEMCKVQDDEVIFPIPDVDNIETISRAMQGMWNNISDETKAAIIENINDNTNFEEIEKIIKKLEDDNFLLNAENITYVDENSLFKLSEDYIDTPNDKPIIQADKKMAKRLMDLNKDHIKAVNRKILNYYLTGLTPNGDVLLVNNQSVRTETFYDNANTLKDKRETYFAEMFNNNDNFIKTLKKRNKNSFLKLLGAWDVLLEKGQKFTAKVETEEEMTPEEYKKAIEEVKKEMAQDKGLIYEFKTALNETKKFIETVEKSEDYISPSNIYVTKTVLDKLLENVEKNRDIIESFDEFRKLQKNISVALNAYKETIFDFVINDGVQPTSDMSRFPKTISNATTITYKELNNLKRGDKEDYKRMAILGFSVKEVGKETSDFAPLLVPIVMYDNNNNVAKFNFGVSNLTKLVDTINTIRELAGKNLKVDDVYKTQLKNLKEKLIETIDIISKQKGSKLFQEDDVKEIKNEIKNALTFQDLEKITKKITNKNLPNVSLLLSTMSTNSKMVSDLLNKKELPNDLGYYQAFGNTVLKKAIENTKELSKEVEESIANYQQYYINTAIKGNRLFYRKNKELTFLPVPGLGNPETDEIIKTIKESVSMIKLTESEEQNIREKYGYKSKNEKLKSLYEKMGSKIKKEAKVAIDNIKNKTIQEKVEMPEEEDYEENPEIEAKSIIEAYENEDNVLVTEETPSIKDNLFDMDIDTEEDLFNNQLLTQEDSLLADDFKEEEVIPQNNTRKL